MEDIEGLKRRFSDYPGVLFRERGEKVVVLEIDNPLATATISLHGGHVAAWRPKHQAEPVLWLSEKVQFKPGKAIRGGVPICWPWFGAHPTDKSLPGHGFARTEPWDVESIRALAGGETEVILHLDASRIQPGIFPATVLLSITIVVGRDLKIDLKTVNGGDREVAITEGLHTYFKVGDIAEIHVEGLDGGEYVDLVHGNARRRQEGAIRFQGELGRIYVDSKATCDIQDPRLKRRIRVEKSGSLSTAVWNPWEGVSSKMDDMVPEGWRGMVCVESANALENGLTIAAGASHTLSVRYSAEDLTGS
jgi:D-hexose-6-phosphate mutarotase